MLSAQSLARRIAHRWAIEPQPHRFDLTGRSGKYKVDGSAALGVHRMVPITDGTMRVRSGMNPPAQSATYLNPTATANQGIANTEARRTQSFALGLCSLRVSMYPLSSECLALLDSAAPLRLTQPYRKQLTANFGAQFCSAHLSVSVSDRNPNSSVPQRHRPTQTKE